ncbi:hypothetical protein TcWFU_005231 [Taenia crassiceps]|uniref:Uncharacterized protein n=1 Tax=Taenia crassiceps TaxID=6207 RepID=A0ABR4QDH0_9CEST
MPRSSSSSDDDHEESHGDGLGGAERTRDVVTAELGANDNVIKAQPCDRQLRDWNDGLFSCHRDVKNWKPMHRLSDHVLLWILHAMSPSSGLQTLVRLTLHRDNTPFGYAFARDIAFCLVEDCID